VLFAIISVVAVFAVYLAAARFRRKSLSLDARPVHAVKHLCAIDTAEVSYSITYGTNSASLSSLGHSGCAQPSEKCAGLIDDELASGTMDGYKFTYVPGQPNIYGRVRSYTIIADPTSPEDTQAAHYFDQNGKIFEDWGGPAGPKSHAILDGYPPQMKNQQRQADNSRCPASQSTLHPAADEAPIADWELEAVCRSENEQGVRCDDPHDPALCDMARVARTARAAGLR